MNYILFTIILFVSCQENKTTAIDKLEENTSKKTYWYNNEAEISSYALSQARYGEMHSGKAVLIFVTEPFSLKKNTKSDTPSKDDVSVLKLNFTKTFNTGIYPYSMMTSTFFPFENGKHSLKISSSSQEWCGHTYMELRGKEKFEVQFSSYFEGESINKVSLQKNYLEDDIWSMIRLTPDDLPIGNTKVIPSFFYLGLLHKELKAYECQLSISKVNDSITKYVIMYPELERTLTINYEADFPHRIVSWQEAYNSGWGENQKRLTTSATIIETMKTDYWNKHSNKDADLRIKLGLEE